VRISFPSSFSFDLFFLDTNMAAFDPKNMQFRRLGSGLQVSAFAVGGKLKLGPDDELRRVHFF
jgi:hypothetical protein